MGNAISDADRVKSNDVSADSSLIESSVERDEEALELF